MSELSEMSCDELADVAAELALGVLIGRERAAALAHLDRCDGCREHVRQLAVTGEELLGLLPAGEPPPGFEARVMAQLGLAAPDRAGNGIRVRVRRTRRVLAVAVAALALAAAGLGGWGLRAATSPPVGSSLSSAALVATGDHPAGQVYVYRGRPAWLYMYVDIAADNDTVTCQVVGVDGRVSTVGSFRLVGGYGSWGSPVPAGTGPLAGARLIGPDGAVLATASLARR